MALLSSYTQHKKNNKYEENPVLYIFFPVQEYIYEHFFCFFLLLFFLKWSFIYVLRDTLFFPLYIYSEHALTTVHEICYIIFLFDLIFMWCILEILCIFFSSGFRHFPYKDISLSAVWWSTKVHKGLIHFVCSKRSLTRFK